MSVLGGLKTTFFEQQLIQFKVLAAVTVSWLTWLVLKRLQRYRRAAGLQQLVDGHRTKCKEVELSLKRALCSDNNQELSNERTRIVELSLRSLIDELQSDRLTAVDVLAAYQWKALQATNKTNCVCMFLSDATEKAKALDQKYRGQSNKPPLYGVPISVKDNVRVKGYPSTRGYAHGVNDVSAQSALVVTLLENLGAVPFCLTNVPQSMLSYMCSNLVYGTSTHPLDSARSPGGSSGGEGALIACGGSPLGIGTDVGGSVRMPAHFCGITGLKPSSIRISQMGLNAAIPGRPYVCASLGPMARDVDSLATFCLHLLSDHMFSRDAYVVPLPFKTDVYEDSRPLTIGFYDNDGYFEALPSCKRAVQVAKAALQKAGHRLVPFQPPDIYTAVSCVAAGVSIDGGQYIADKIQLCDFGLVDPMFVKSLQTMATPLWMRRVMSFIVAPFHKRRSHILGSYVQTPAEVRAMYERLEKYRRQFSDAWIAAGLDAVICPAQACTALPHSYAMRLTTACSYTFLYNMLDFCAGVVPVTTVTAVDEALLADYRKIDDFSAIAVEGVRGSIGMPVGVQCAALPLREEVCLRVMKVIESNI